MRDTVKDEAYFNRVIQYKLNEISEIEELLEDLPADNKTGLRNGQKFLQQFYRDIVICKYSAGNDVLELKEPFVKMLSYAELTADDELGNFKTTEILALAVLLDIHDNSLLDIVEKSKVNDKLLDIFLQYFDPELTSNASDTIYTSLLEAVHSDTPEDSIADYLENKWYIEHEDADWYDSARSNSDTYCGYWATEVAALVKIMKISDEKLKNCNYYPYDMIHY